MNLSLKIAARYLLGKKSTNAINIITWVSVVGMSIGSAALILILSVFNGFEDLLSGMLNSFNPDIKAEIVKGKFESIENVDTAALRAIDGVEAISFTIEETAFFTYKGSQEVGTIKGVDAQFGKVTDIEKALIAGKMIPEDDNIVYGILGSGMNTRLSVNPGDPFTPVTAYMYSPKNKNPLGKDFKTLAIYPAGVFSVGNDVDIAYIITGFEEVNYLLDLEDHFSAIEFKLIQDAGDKQVISRIQTVLGDNFTVKNRYQQDEGFLRIMNIEKWVSYLIACLTLAVIAFNLVGSLWMIVLDKKKDVAILKSMGYTTPGIRRIFMFVGMMISAIGLLAGIIIALIFYFLQKRYGLISIPEGFLIDAYPIMLRLSDFILVALTVVFIGYLASLLPSIRAGQISAYVRQE
ncbi:MAG: ABC transporter permease [Saprospiraceae bacterium]|nr:ABC transporter permease [Saprospiraceae bacterium]